jgi:hypothetical protein
MNVAILGGTGKEGRGLAIRWARAGHRVLLGSRDAARGRARAAEIEAAAGRSVEGGANEWAAEECDVAVLSVPYAAHAETLRGLGDRLAGRIVIDLTVPLVPPKLRVVSLPRGQAAALEAQQILGAGTAVVAALHHVSSVHLAAEHAVDCDVLACSDDAHALEIAMDLIRDLGLRVLDAGPLVNAIALESLTPVLLHLNQRYASTGVGIKLTGIARP